MMRTSKEEAIAKMLATFLAAYPQTKMNPSGLVLYSKTLKCFSLPEIEAAMTKLLATSKFFPSIAEIIDEIKTVREVANDDREPTAAEAWGEVAGFAKEFGIYSPWPYSRTEIKEAVRQFGGRTELCLIELDNLGTARAQFMRIYNSIIAKNHDDNASKWALNKLGPDKRAELMKKKVNQVTADVVKKMNMLGEKK
jgi:hypothetical protein